MTGKNGHKTYMTFVLDETGSMMSCRDETISGFNEFIDSQQDKTLGECRVTLVKFNLTKVETVYADKSIEDVPALTPDTYRPDNLTPLYDAIAQAIKETDAKVSTSRKVLSRLAGHEVAAGPLVIIVIMTDGAENASKQFKRDDIFKMIQEKQDLGWTFVFLGADQDSWRAAAPMGIPVGNIADYNSKKTFKAFAGVSQAMCDYRSSYTNLTDQYAMAEDAGDQKLVAETTAELKKLRVNYWAGKKNASE